MRFYSTCIYEAFPKANLGENVCNCMKKIRYTRSSFQTMTIPKEFILYRYMYMIFYGMFLTNSHFFSNNALVSTTVIFSSDTELCPVIQTGKYCSKAYRFGLLIVWIEKMC